MENTTPLEPQSHQSPTKRSNGILTEMVSGVIFGYKKALPSFSEKATFLGMTGASKGFGLKTLLDLYNLPSGAGWDRIGDLVGVGILAGAAVYFHRMAGAYIKAKIEEHGVIQQIDEGMDERMEERSK